MHCLGIPLAHLMARQTFAKRTRQAILEIEWVELQNLLKTETFLAVLFQDDSKVTYTLTENSQVSGASLKKAEIFYGNFDIFGHTK